MSGIRGVGSGDPNRVNGVQNQGEVDSAQSISGNQTADPVEKQEQISEKEKKALQEYAADRVAEEQLKAQVKQTQLSTELDASNTGKTETPENNDRTYFIHSEGDNQPVPFRKQNGELQRWDVHDKKWS